MNRYTKSRGLARKIASLTVPVSVAVLIFMILPSRTETFTVWETPKKTVLNGFSDGNVRYKEFYPKRDPKYENKIMNYILAIDENLRAEMSIIRTRTNPVRDYLFLKNKLYSVLELYGVIPKGRLDDLLARLTAAYGKPQLRNEKNMAIYTFASETTKVFVHSSKISQDFECRVYYYSANLFRRLVTE
jgi:hypothetical protein